MRIVLLSIERDSMSAYLIIEITLQHGLLNFRLRLSVFILFTDPLKYYWQYHQKNKQTYNRQVAIHEARYFGIRKNPFASRNISCGKAKAKRQRKLHILIQGYIGSIQAGIPVVEFSPMESAVANA